MSLISVELLEITFVVSSIAVSLVLERLALINVK
nr:MAG TPA: hypothetical protein [Bacteriophage sp.]